ncbi:MAG: hypothetical protein LBH94_03290 [Deltaproteobacteria bacterium]|nr:hypothetical protein [Deltaproteobacteria bacterium]
MLSPLSLAQSTDMMLGQEFLTWLWHRSDAHPDGFRDAANAPFQLAMGRSVVVQGGEGAGLETAAVSGALSPLREARFGLAAGKKVTRAALLLEQDGLRWQLSLRAEDFAVSGLKAPKLDHSDADDDPDALFLERVYLIERCMALLDSLYAAFLRLRLSPQWADEARRVHAWMAEQA